MDESINFCKELQKNGPASISNSLKCINDSYDYSLEDGLETELEAFSNSFGSKEADEGLLAFVDKESKIQTINASLCYSSSRII